MKRFLIKILGMHGKRHIVREKLALESMGVIGL